MRRYGCAMRAGWYDSTPLHTYMYVNLYIIYINLGATYAPTIKKGGTIRVKKPIIIQMRPIRRDKEEPGDKTYNVEKLKRTIRTICLFTGSTWHWRKLKKFIDWTFDETDTREFEDLNL